MNQIVRCETLKRKLMIDDETNNAFIVVRWKNRKTKQTNSCSVNASGRPHADFFFGSLVTYDFGIGKPNSTAIWWIHWYSGGVRVDIDPFWTTSCALAASARSEQFWEHIRWARHRHRKQFKIELLIAFEMLIVEKPIHSFLYSFVSLY